MCRFQKKKYWPNVKFWGLYGQKTYFREKLLKMLHLLQFSWYLAMYTLYIVLKIVLRFHKDISNGYRNINQISGLSSPKLGILHIKVHLLWNRDKMLAPRIAFPVPTEYVQVKERKKINFQITFFSTFCVTQSGHT